MARDASARRPLHVPLGRASDAPRHRPRGLSAAALLVALAVAGLAGAGAPPNLLGNVGPGFDISLLRETGGRVARLEPGRYALAVTDQASLHSFHLVGPGVDVGTTIEGEEARTFEIDVVTGVYRFYCDIHYPQMLGSFSVGTPLRADVGPAARIGVFGDDGSRATTAIAATYLLVVRDRSARDNFHLSGPGVDRRTGIRARGSARWLVRLVRGRVYIFRSDARPRLRGTLRAV